MFPIDSRGSLVAELEAIDKHLMRLEGVDCRKAQAQLASIHRRLNSLLHPSLEEFENIQRDFWSLTSKNNLIGILDSIVGLENLREIGQSGLMDKDLDDKARLKASIDAIEEQIRNCWDKLKSALSAKRGG